MPYVTIRDMAALEVNIAIGDATFHASGDASTVMKALDEFKTLVETSPRTRRQTPAKDEKPGGDSDGGGGAEITEPLAVFVKRAWPNQASKATAIAMWAKQRDSKPALRPGEIEAYWRKTTGKPPANPSQVCATAESNGWLHNEGGGSYSVTGHGEAMVMTTPKSS